MLTLLVSTLLRLLALRAETTDLDALAASIREHTPEVGWNDVERL